MPGPDKPKLLGRALGQVDHPAFDKRAAVVDAHHERPAGLGIGDLDLRAERQRLVRGGHRRRVHHLARRGARMQRIPGCAATFRESIAGEYEDGRQHCGGDCDLSCQNVYPVNLKWGLKPDKCGDKAAQKSQDVSKN